MIQHSTFTHSDDDPFWSVQALSEVAKLLLTYLPGNAEAQLLLARANFLTGNASAALTLSNQVLKADTNNPQIYLLQAQIQVYMGQLRAAASSLETGVSCNFSVRSDPVYHYLKAKCDRASGNWEDAGSSLSSAMSLMTGSQSLSKDGARRGSVGTPVRVPTGIRLALYLETSDVYVHKNQLDKAADSLREGLKYFPSGTFEEAKIKLALADLDILRGLPLDGVIATLNSITSDVYSPESYRTAKVKLADIYLKEKLDSKMFIRCYQEICERYPSNADCLQLLGDAYMQIQESDEAIRIYEGISHRFPEKAQQLGAKIGHAWIRTHNFRKVSLHAQSIH